jgi:hypothetical protein
VHCSEDGENMLIEKVGDDQLNIPNPLPPQLPDIEEEVKIDKNIIIENGVKFERLVSDTPEEEEDLITPKSLPDAPVDFGMMSPSA